ncbi:hypothetical protein [Chryseobacterium sp. FH1]|uniref:hypothetical protein n=1 Tax=Chryseobacterium sp. FH1 TaxID=1233951 RepID=UPI0004E3335F|nr:hypothetical protein [Chryseobacterium sp. FH1]KFC19538.1 hypothetical protein IO90_09645 [Chryseobacterium sp. FH1]
MKILEKYGILEAGKDFVWFDCESFEEGETYTELIRNLSSISKTKFSPQNLIIENEGWTENREHYIVEINFTLNNENYQIKLLCEEWFDYDLIIELNKIIVKEKIKEQFYPIKTVDQSLIIVFGDTLLKEYLSIENVLEDSDKLILKKPLNFNSLKLSDV